MAVTLHASGTQTATVTTEHSLSTVTVTGAFSFHIDTVNMAAGDILELRIYRIILTGGTKRQLLFTAYYGAQPAHDLIKESNTILNDLGDASSLEFTLKQTFGTGRNYPWKVLREDSGTAQTGDSYPIVSHASYGNAQLVRATTPANTLDVSATGEAGLDFNNIKDATGAHTLTNIVLDTGAITAASIATDAFGAAELAADAVNEIADGILSRGVSNVEGTAVARSLAGAVSKLVNKVDIAGNTLTIRKTDDATAYFTQTLTTDANQNPIVSADTV